MPLAQGITPRYHRSMKKSSRSAICGTLAMVLTSLIAPPVFAADGANRQKLVVLDIELTGDLGGPQFTAEHEARLRKESDLLREELRQSGLYTLLDLAPAQSLVTKLKSQQ